MYQNFSNNITVSIKTNFEERVIDTKNDTLIWHYTITIKNSSDKCIRLKSIEFSAVNEFGENNNHLSESFVDKNVIVKPDSEITRCGIIATENHSSIVFGKILAFTELDEDITIEIPTFSLDSPYYYYNTIN